MKRIHVERSESSALLLTFRSAAPAYMHLSNVFLADLLHTGDYLFGFSYGGVFPGSPELLN